MVTGVALLSCLACTVSCRPTVVFENSSPGTTNKNNYMKDQQYQQQAHRYDTHHHQHRSTNTEKSHNHHHNTHPPHHSNKRGQPHHHHQEKQQQQYHYRQPEDVFQRVTEIDESNRFSELHDTSGSRSSYSPQPGKRRKQQQQPPVALPVVEVPSSIQSIRATTTTSSSSSENSPTTRRLHVKPVEDDYEDEYDEDEDDASSGGGRHAYLMTTDKKKSTKEKLTEDQVLTQAFEKHMRPSNMKANPKDEFHDVYAYQLPSDLWFVVRYGMNADGQIEKYMNVVDSFTNYLDKLDQDVKTVSVNVKGVETVFRLTTKQNSKNDS